MASVLGFPPENVRVITPWVGGGFGGKASNRQTGEAARLAKLTGKPVQVAWTRAEEFFYDTFRPAAVVKVKAGIDGSGRMTLWDYGLYFAGERGAQHYYDIQHHRTVSFGSGWRGTPGSHPFGTGAWRAPGNNTNTFARECQVDALAAVAGMDPLEFRVKRVACAQDMGLSINPEGSKIQMEGCITMGLGYALREDIHFKGGEILDKNFDTDEIPRFSWLPEIETVLIEDRKAAPQGGGEPACVSASPTPRADKNGLGDLSIYSCLPFCFLSRSIANRYSIAFLASK